MSNATGDAVTGCPSSCRFQFTGGPGEKSKLKQKFKLPAGFKTAINDTARIDFTIETPNPETANLTLKLKIAYKDGTPATIVSFKPQYWAPAGQSGYFTLLAQTTGKSVGSITVELANKSTAGVINIRAVSDIYESATVASRNTKGHAGVLPPPPAPGTR